MLRISDFLTALGFLKYHAQAALARAENIAATPYEGLHDNMDAMEELCRGVFILQFEEKARKFCGDDPYLETLLQDAEHPREVIDGFFDQIIPMMDKAEFYETLEEETHRRHMEFDTDFTEMYFANLETYGLRILGEIYNYDFEAQRVSDDIHRKFMPPREPN